MKEEEIRPKAILEEYLRLSAKDGANLNKEKFQISACQGCGDLLSDLAFIKNGYHYVSCLSCHSLYCSPRPSKEQLDSLYFNSESSAFWSNVFFPSVVEARRQKLFVPKAKKIANLIRDRRLRIKTICDVGAGHGIFLEELRRELPDCEFFAIEPDHTSATVCREKGFSTLEEVSENAGVWQNKFDLILCSEVVEHVHDTNKFLFSLNQLLKSDGYCLVTGLGYEGFDILTLQEKSNAVSPPHHLNFLSIEGFSNAFRRANFSQTEIWTPGELDVDIVLNSEMTNEFLKTLKRRGEKAIHDFQKFLREHQLSSHCWILARK